MFCYIVISNVFFLFLQNNNYVDDLFIDLCDGRLLICFFEIIFGDKLGKIGMNLLDNKYYVYCRCKFVDIMILCYV